MGVSQELAHSAITGKIGDYKGLLRSEPVQLMDELRSDYEAMAPEERAVLDDAVRQYEADGEANPESWAALLEAYLGADAREVGTVLGGVDMEQLVKWVQTGDVYVQPGGADPAVRPSTSSWPARRTGAGRQGARTENAGQRRVSIADVARGPRSGTS
jgi:hypothetical protein